MPARLTLFAAAIAMAFAVALGAFGAHALKARLAADALAIWQTAVQYHAWHALGLLGIGLWQRQAPESCALRVAALLLAAGIVLFSGSLYALALTGARGLGAVTPFGGIAFIAGWLALAKAARDVNGRRTGE
ncbi:MAG: DUF423 domain-containing protein [Betaproteobacteria bacterium]|nr:DUF423 domain-containing protein [Betaproteobacteria bacterium]